MFSWEERFFKEIPEKILCKKKERWLKKSYVVTWKGGVKNGQNHPYGINEQPRAWFVRRELSCHWLAIHETTWNEKNLFFQRQVYVKNYAQ